MSCDVLSQNRPKKCGSVNVNSNQVWLNVHLNFIGSIWTEVEICQLFSCLTMRWLMVWFATGRLKCCKVVICECFLTYPCLRLKKDSVASSSTRSLPNGRAVFSSEAIEREPTTLKCSPRPVTRCELLNIFARLAAIQATKPCPTQSPAIVTLRMLPTLCAAAPLYCSHSLPVNQAFAWKLPISLFAS